MVAVRPGHLSSGLFSSCSNIVAVAMIVCCLVVEVVCDDRVDFMEEGLCASSEFCCRASVERKWKLKVLK